jgi:hypothetical protein
MLSSTWPSPREVDAFPSRSGLAVPVREVDDHFVGCLLESPGGCLSREAALPYGPWTSGGLPSRARGPQASNQATVYDAIFGKLTLKPLRVAV